MKTLFSLVILSLLTLSFAQDANLWQVQSSFSNVSPYLQQQIQPQPSYISPSIQENSLQFHHFDPPYQAPPTPAPVRRHVVVGGFIYLTDDETFGSNEHGSAEGRAEAVLTQDLPQHVMYLEGRAGGEMRVELSLSAQARASGDVIVSGQAILFEGTSEQTTDRDGDEYFELLIPRDSFISHRLVVRNEDEGGDFAEITLNFSNYAAP